MLHACGRAQKPSLRHFFNGVFKFEAPGLQKKANTPHGVMTETVQPYDKLRFRVLGTTLHVHQSTCTTHISVLQCAKVRTMQLVNGSTYAQ